MIFIAKVKHIYIYIYIYNFNFLIVIMPNFDFNEFLKQQIFLIIYILRIILIFQMIKIMDTKKNNKLYQVL